MIKAFLAKNSRNTKSISTKSIKWKKEALPKGSSADKPVQPEQEIIKIRSFEQISDLLNTDQCWYLIYECILETEEQFSLSYDDSRERETKKQLFDTLAVKNLERMLSRHVFHGSKVRAGIRVLREGQKYFALHLPDQSSCELGVYLNYMEQWSLQHPDWIKQPAHPLSSMEIVTKISRFQDLGSPAAA
jgi:hypothetical protein